MAYSKMLALAVLAMVAASGYAQSRAPAPAPGGIQSTRTSKCSIPSGSVIDAPENAGTSQQLTIYWTYTSWTYISYSYYYYCGCGRRLARALLQSNAPAPSAYPACCPATTTRSGDTVSNLISSAGLPEEAKVFFYTINPNVANNTETLSPGLTVTVPCFRITEYNRRLGAAPAPSTVQASG